MQDQSLSGAQIRAARALLRWSAEELARKASLGHNTIKRAEANNGKTSLTTANELAIRRALESAGVEFTNGEQPGVRLSKAAAEVLFGLGLPEAATKKQVRGKTIKAVAKKRR
jgi:transcriptional regulator with XRE-family HTH domain